MQLFASLCMKMKIEEAKDTDINDLLAIFNEAKSSATGFINTETDLENFLQEINGEKIYVARISNEIVGFLSIWERENFIHHLYITPEYQSQGIGNILLKECVRNYGLPLTLKCMKDNERACAFYARNGWTEKSIVEGPEGVYIEYQLDNV